jgi:hypothetical protein
MNQRNENNPGRNGAQPPLRPVAKAADRFSPPYAGDLPPILL